MIVKNLFILLDTSDNMKGSIIGAINDAIPNMLQAIMDRVEKWNAGINVEFRVAVMSYSDECHWMYPTPQKIEDFKWINQTAGGSSNFGKACMELANKWWQIVDKRSWDTTVLVFMGSKPSDDYEPGIKVMKLLRKIGRASALAVPIGVDADLYVLAKFTGNIEMVISVHDVECLMKIIPRPICLPAELKSGEEEAYIEWYLSENESAEERFKQSIEANEPIGEEEHRKETEHAVEYKFFKDVQPYDDIDDIEHIIAEQFPIQKESETNEDGLISVNMDDNW